MGDVVHISDVTFERATGRKFEKPKRRMSLQTKLARETQRALEGEAKAERLYELYRAAIDMLRSRARFAPEAEGTALMQTAERMAHAIGMRLGHVGWTPTLQHVDPDTPPPPAA